MGKKMKYGVQQGTIPGLILYNIYLNDFYIIYYKHNTRDALKQIIKDDFKNIMT